MLSVLLLEDDLILSKEVKEFLEKKQLKCDVVHDGELFLQQFSKADYDLYLLDLNVPKINGLDICKSIRERKETSPIIVATAFGEIEDKIQAFDLGADDYLVKPFHLEELLARILALNRRNLSTSDSTNIISIGEIKIDQDNKTVIRNNQEISLTPKEYKLLLLLAKAKGRVLSKQQIASELWDYHIETNQNTIEVYINFLRNKLDKGSKTKLIHTKVGFGYFIKED
ncbi:MAG: response regulator transcription factor [Chitinophagaceae bacterium]|nr:response regulator transcription factor [Chitinophagaceae bacterium]